MDAALCPSCRTPVPPGARFCISCGAALPETAPDLDLELEGRRTRPGAWVALGAALALMSVGVVTVFIRAGGRPQEAGVPLLAVRLEEGRTYRFRVTRITEGTAVLNDREREVRARAVEDIALRVSQMGTSSFGELTAVVESFELGGEPADARPAEPITVEVGPEGQLLTSSGFGVPSPIARETLLPDLGQILPLLVPERARPGESWTGEIHVPDPGGGHDATVETTFQEQAVVEGLRVARLRTSVEVPALRAEVARRGNREPGTLRTEASSLEQHVLLEIPGGRLVGMESERAVALELELPGGPRDGSTFAFDGTIGLTLESLD